MARCKECIHYAVCAKEGRMVQVDEHTWDDYNQLDNVECFCENYISAADVAPRAEVFEAVDKFSNDLMDKFIDLCRGNDYNKLTLLKIDDVVCEIYDKQIAELKKKYTGG
jgi:hypothetical protein